MSPVSIICSTPCCGKILQDILHLLVNFDLVDVAGLMLCVVDSRNEQVGLNMCEETARIVLNLAIFGKKIPAQNGHFHFGTKKCV